MRPQTYREPSDAIVRFAHRPGEDGDAIQTDLYHRKVVTRLVLQVQDTRSQARNREIARERLAELVRSALTAPRPRIATRPTLGSQRRRLTAKTTRGVVKSLRGRVEVEE